MLFVTHALALVSSLGVVSGDDRPLNVLWIIGEDLGPELACYGHPEVRTPHLDRLAAEGVRFTRAFATAPVCSASRSAFMTGMHQVTIGAHNHRSHRDDGHGLPEGVRVLTDWLRPAGVFTANLRALGIDEDGEPQLRGSGKTDWNFAYDGRAFDGRAWDELKDRRPFYAQVNFPETHRGRAWNTAHERIERPADPAAVHFPPYYPDHPEMRAVWAQYLNAVMALDVKVGHVLRLLERDGLADDTVVIFFGDHGRAMVRGKQWPYDSGLHVPLIVRWPRDRAPAGVVGGSVDHRLVALTDVTATTLRAFGVDAPESMHGRPLFGPDRGAPRRVLFGARDRCDETVFHIRTVRDVRYRYIRNGMPERPFLRLNRYKEASYPELALMRRLHESGELARTAPFSEALFAPSRPSEELYDLAADPFETRNLAGDPALGATLARLREALNARIAALDDQGEVPEPAEVIEHWEETMRKRHGG